MIYVYSSPIPVATTSSPPTDTKSSPSPPPVVFKHPPQYSPLPHLSPPSETEARCYYAGLVPSPPRLVARSGTTPWKAPPTGQEAEEKELRPAGNHVPGLKAVWGDKLGPRLLDLLRSMNVKWTSIQIVRMVIAEEYFPVAPVVLWIGVTPKSLSGENGVVVVSKCCELLDEYDITDVEVEICESIVCRLGSHAQLQ